MQWIMVLWLFKALGQITMVAERRASSHWLWAFYSSSSFCYMRLRFESTTPTRHGFTTHITTPLTGSKRPMVLWCDRARPIRSGGYAIHCIGKYLEGWSSLTGKSSIDGLEYAGRDLRRRCDILENGKAVGRFRHDRKSKAALRAWLCEPRLLLVQIVRLILCMPTARTYSDEPRALEFKVYDYVFYDRASANGPLFGVLVVGVHVPIFERFEAGPEADLIVPCRVVRVRPQVRCKKPGNVFR
jgi:hypothetical protein